MSYPLASLEFPPDWKGLYARRQRIPEDDPHLYAAIASDVEFYGSVMRKRQGSFLLNGISDTLATTMATGATVMPGLSRNLWSDFSTWLTAGMQVKVRIVKPGDPYFNVRSTFTVVSLVGNTLTVSPAAGHDFPAGSPMLVLPYTQDRRISGIFQGRYRNGSQPMLVNTISNVTATAGEFKLHLLGNRICQPLNQFQRIAQTTVTAWHSQGYVQLASVDGLQVGDWINFSNATMGADNFQVAQINPVTRDVWSTPFTGQIVPTPVFGNPVRFLPTTCPGRVSPATPVGSGKMSASHMGNRTVMAFSGYPPLRYAHTDSAMLHDYPTTAKNTFNIDQSWPTSLVGRGVVLSDTADPDGIGHVHLRTISAISGLQITVTPDLPYQLTPGAAVDVYAVSRVGLRAPTSPPNLAVIGGAGTLLGSYSVRFTYVSTEGGVFVESEACAQPSNRVTADATYGTLAITQIPTPLDPRVTKKRIYRTSSGGDGVWYFTAEIDPSIGYYLDEKKDSLLGAQLQEFVNYPPYESMEVVVEWPHAQRLMGIAQLGGTAWAVVWSDGPDVLRSQPKPESWPVDNYLFIGLDSGDRPRGIAAFYDSMLIFCERSIWRIQGNPPDLVVEPVNFQQHQQSGIGLLSHQTIVVDQNEVIFPGPDGVYLLNRYSGVQSGFQSQRISRQIDVLWDETDSVRRRTRAHAVYVRSRRQYRLFWPILSTPNAEPTGAFVYQFDADVDGSPHYWSQWAWPDTPSDRTYPTASTVAQPEPGDSSLFASVYEVCFVGTRDGAILGLDYMDDPVGQGQGYCDYTIYPVPMQYMTLPFAPGGGFGISALGRMLHLALALGAPQPHPNATPSTKLRVIVWASQFPVVEGVGGQLLPLAHASFEVDDTTQGSLTNQYLTLLRFILLCRGQYHWIELVDDPNDRAVELSRMVYLFQRLPETVIPEDYVQVEPID